MLAATFVHDPTDAASNSRTTTAASTGASSRSLPAWASVHEYPSSAVPY